MTASKHFSLPYSGMKDGMHHYSMHVDDQFFNSFDQSLISGGNFVVDIDVDKRSGMSVLIFRINGLVSTTCDRCLADIRLPVETDKILHIKIGNPEDSDDEVIYIEEDAINLDLSSVIFEFICLALPLMKIIDCERLNPRPCNMDVLSHLNHNDDNENDKEDDWNVFKDFKL